MNHAEIFTKMSHHKSDLRQTLNGMLNRVSISLFTVSFDKEN